MRRHVPSGLSLVEVLVAVAVFAIVALAAYAALDSGNKAYRRGTSSSEMQQRTRIAFDLVTDELRLAGFDHNRDGQETSYPDHPDEQLEYLAEHAIAFRGNLDYNDGNGGREPDLERDQSYADYLEACCPIVTTANDEIVAYALRSADPTANTDDLVVRVDTSAPRDASWAEDGAILDEEEIIFPDVDLSDDNPPYTLYRFTLASDGSVVEQAIADNVRTLTFSFEAEDGNEYYCQERAADGTCPTAQQVVFSTLAGGDDLVAGDGQGRAGRADVRALRVSLVGMDSLDDHRYVDQDDYEMPHRRKLALEGAVAPPNLGRSGHPDIEDTTVPSPENVDLCGGQCNTVRIEWDSVLRAVSYQVGLFVEGATQPFFTGNTPGVIVEGSDPERYYAVYQRLDAPAIVDGATVFARLQARTRGEELSDESEPSALLTLSDVTRVEAPREVSATGYDPAVDGWPEVDLYTILPVTEGTTPHRAKDNAIVVSWVAPEWALDVLDAGDPANSWTTQQDSGGFPALDCDAQGIDDDGDGVIDRERTWQREMMGDIRYFVFRSTDPRFVPTPADLVGTILGDVDVETGRVSFRDETIHDFAGQVFNQTRSALQTCVTYYYRVRAVDDCYTGSDASVRNDPHLSPFAPPLNDDPTALDSDDIAGIAPENIGPAIPGFAVPRSRPLAPREVRFTNYDFDVLDGDGIDATLAFDAVKKDRLEIPPENAFASPTYDFDDVAIVAYDVYSHATDANFTLAQALSGLHEVRWEKTIMVRDLFAGRIARDDENGDGVVSPAEDESIPPAVPDGSPVSGLRIAADGLGSRYYRLAAVYCEDEKTVPSGNDDAWDGGYLSEAVKFPCEFGGGPFSLIEVDSSSFPDSVDVTSYVDDPMVPAEWARLVLSDPVTGDRTLSPRPGVAVDAAGHASFGAAHIAALTDAFGSGDYRISVEMTDGNDCVGFSDVEDFTQTLPACCLAPGPLPADPDAPFAETTTNLRIRADLHETCGTADPRIYQIELDIGNENNGQPERFTEVWWDDDLLWSGSNRSVVIDRSASPISVPALTAHSLWMDFSRAPAGDTLVVTIRYRIAGAEGVCTFTQANVQ